MISVLMPWRESSPERRRVFEWVTARLSFLLPGHQLCLGDSGHDQFNRGASINRAFEEATGDMLLISDADTVFNYFTVETAIDLAAERSWVLPYTEYLNLDAETTQRLLGSVPDVDIDEAKVGTDHRLTDSVSGLIVLSRPAFEQVGGFDEKFRSWGYEDRAFESAANTLVGPCSRLIDCCFHLDHPTTARFEQPQIEFNRLRAQEYKRLEGNHQAMRQLVSQ